MARIVAECVIIDFVSLAESISLNSPAPAGFFFRSTTWARRRAAAAVARSNGMLKRGDLITLPGRYKRRTLWQWLTREPKELQTFRIVDDVIAGGFAEYEPADTISFIRFPNGYRATTLQTALAREEAIKVTLCGQMGRSAA